MGSLLLRFFMLDEVSCAHMCAACILHFLCFVTIVSFELEDANRQGMQLCCRRNVVWRCPWRRATLGRRQRSLARACRLAGRLLFNLLGLFSGLWIFVAAAPAAAAAAAAAFAAAGLARNSLTRNFAQCIASVARFSDIHTFI